MFTLAQATGLSFGGGLNEQQNESISSLMKQGLDLLSNVGGFFGTKVQEAKTSLDYFVNSRLWELSNRLKKDNGYVGAFEIGVLHSLYDQQQAMGLMRNYIMANPTIMDLYNQELISGYEGEFNSRCVGIEDDNPFYRQAMHGVNVLKVDKETNEVSGYHKHYIDDSPKLTVLDRVNIQRTWNASNRHMLDTMFDVTSPLGSDRKDPNKKQDE